MSGSNPQTHLLLLLALVLILLGQFSSSVQSLRFELQSGHTKCIAEDIKRFAMTVGKYNITNPDESHQLPDSHRVAVSVTSPKGSSYHEGDGVESGQFAFQAVESGDYMTCFSAPNHNPQITLTIDFDWRTGVAANHVWSTVAKKSKVDLMTLQVKYLHETVSSIHEEMFYLRKREEEDEELSWETNNEMLWLSFLSLFVCLSVAGLQLWHLKTFFEKKKII